MENELTFSGDFTVKPRRTLAPAAWYIGFACRNCNSHFAMLDEPTNSGKLNLSGAATFHAVCPSCGVLCHYQTSDLILFESAQGGSVSTA